MTTKVRKSAALMALMLCAARLATAQTSNSIVTFQVDLSVQVTNGTFIPGTDTVAARGTFNGYGQFNLTNNPAGANTNLYTGTVTDTSDANGGTLQYKFYTSDASGGWENTATGNNRAAKLPATSGASLVLPVAFYGDTGPATTNLVKFQVDMAQQINLGLFTPTTELDVKGGLNGWAGGASILTNDTSIKTTNSFGLVSSNVWVGTFPVSGSPGGAQAFKFYYNNGSDQWDSPSSANQNGGGNRYFANVAQTLPIVYFSDAPYAPVVSNNVTFQVDMTAQILGGAFDPSQNQAAVVGSFDGWASGNPIILTNNTAASNTNIYSAVVPITDGVGSTEHYKFIHNITGGGLNWENPGPGSPQDSSGNRIFTLANTNATTLPVVFYSDQGTSDLLLTNTLVTFTVNMAGAVGTDSTAWDTNQSVYINGDFVGWPAWGGTPPVFPQMSNNPVGSSFYTFQTNLPAGKPVSVTYKYSINGADNEAGFAQNHFRYVRQLGSYSFPVDTFGSQLSEISFGNLKAGTPAAGHIPVTWLGRPGVHLQVRTNLTTGAWVDHPETDATSSNSWPVSGSSIYFRLIHPAQ